MKSFVRIAAGMALALTAMLANAQTQTPDTGWYIGGSIGQSQLKFDDGSLQVAGATSQSISKDESDTAWKIFAGYRFGKYVAIEGGWTDRLLASPAPRWVLLAGTVLAASARALIPATFVFVIALLLGAGWPGIGGLLVAYFMVAAMAAVAACWGSALALRFKSQSAAPLMQAGTMALVLTTTAYAPLALLQPWMKSVAEVNPVTEVIEAARQGFVGSVTLANTWPGVVALLGLLTVLGAWALREMRRTAA